MNAQRMKSTRRNQDRQLLDQLQRAIGSVYGADAEKAFLPLTLKDVIDPQAAGDQAKAYTALRAASMHMGKIADPLAGAISKQFPDRFGMTTGPTNFGAR